MKNSLVTKYFIKDMTLFGIISGYALQSSGFGYIGRAKKTTQKSLYYNGEYYNIILYIIEKMDYW